MDYARALRSSTERIAGFGYEIGCNKSANDELQQADLNRLVATWWNWQACCNLLQQAGKIDNLQQVCDVFGCVQHPPPPALFFTCIEMYSSNILFWFKIITTVFTENFFFVSKVFYFVLKVFYSSVTL